MLNQPPERDRTVQGGGVLRQESRRQDKACYPKPACTDRQHGAGDEAYLQTIIPNQIEEGTTRVMSGGQEEGTAAERETPADLLRPKRENKGCGGHRDTDQTDSPAEGIVEREPQGGHDAHQPGGRAADR